MGRLKDRFINWWHDGEEPPDKTVLKRVPPLDDKPQYCRNCGDEVRMAIYDTELQPWCRSCARLKLRERTTLMDD